MVQLFTSCPAVLGSGVNEHEQFATSAVNDPSPFGLQINMLACNPQNGAISAMVVRGRAGGFKITMVPTSAMAQSA